MFRVKIFKDWSLLCSIEGVSNDAYALSSSLNSSQLHIVYDYHEQEENLDVSSRKLFRVELFFFKTYIV